MMYRVGRQHQLERLHSSGMVMRGQGFLYDRVEVEPDVDQTDHEHKNHRTPLSTRNPNWFGRARRRLASGNRSTERRLIEASY